MRRLVLLTLPLLLAAGQASAQSSFNSGGSSWLSRKSPVAQYE